MITPTHMRRLALLATAAVWLLVVGGLGWATHTSLELHRKDAEEQARADFDARRTRALLRLDAFVAPALSRERSRPYYHYRRYYRPASALTQGGHEFQPIFLLPSPISNAPEPNWLLLHFMLSDTGRYVSPQVEQDPRYSVPISEFAPDERRHVRPEHWLAALQYTYEHPEELLHLITETEIWNSQARLARPFDRHLRDAGDAGAADPSEGSALQGRPSETARLIERLLQYNQEETCDPEAVALENLIVEPIEGSRPPDAQECIVPRASTMTAVWLDLTADGTSQLALVRTVSLAPARPACVVQGVLVDWGRLRAALKHEIQDLFVRAELTPVFPRGEPSGDELNWMMATLPVRLIPHEQAVAAMALAGDQFLRLAAIWIAGLAVLLAVTYGVVKYLAVTERRMRFVAAVTHELRTPLTSFQLYTDLLADADDPAARGRYVEVLRGESKRLGRLVENVLAYARMGRGGPNLQRRETKPADILESVRVETAGRCEAAGMELVVEDRCQSGVFLRTDGAFVVQILAHLVDNACKYAGDAADRSVRLRAQADNGQVTFEVEDAGRGIPPGERRAIFRPFRRGRDASAEGVGGMGLGLSLSRHWAECLGGSLTLRRGPCNAAHYACFVLNLPIQPTRRAPLNPASTDRR